MTEIKHIFIVSDATGVTCERVTKAALAQFEEQNVELHKKPFVRSPQEVEGALREALELGGMVVYTLVGLEERKRMAEMSEKLGVPALDILGPLLLKFAQLLGGRPAEVPGLYQDLINEH